MREDRAEMSVDIHGGQRVLRAGAELGKARGAAILIHGRGATAGSILGLAEALARPDFHYLAPQAAGNTWYPYPFMEPRGANEPHLSSALLRMLRLVEELGAAGMPAERVAIIGFSQGACLASDFAVRHPRRYGGIGVLSGGLIGSTIDPEDYVGSLAGTPVFVGCSDVDGHIPVERVKLTSAILGGLGASVTERIYPGMGHSVNEDEIAHLQAMLDGVRRSGPA
jgi:predicted esterase